MFKNKRKVLDLELEYKRKKFELQLEYDSLEGELTIAISKLEIEHTEKEIELRDSLSKLQLKCNKLIGEYEHTYHSTKEAKGIEIAELDSYIVARKKTFKNEISIKDKVIADQKETIASLITTIGKLGGNAVSVIK